MVSPLIRASASVIIDRAPYAPVSIHWALNSLKVRELRMIPIIIFIMITGISILNRMLSFSGFDTFFRDSEVFLVDVILSVLSYIVR